MRLLASAGITLPSYTTYEGVAHPDEFEEIPPWVTRQEVEEIVRAEADRIISELKHNPIKK
jgi:hypothetical protein